MSKTTDTDKRGDKLHQLLKALPKSERESFAKRCGTTVKHLEDLAAADDPNPSARLAFAIQDLSCLLAKHMSGVPAVMARQLCGAPEQRR